MMASVTTQVALTLRFWEVWISPNEHVLIQTRKGRFNPQHSIEAFSIKNEPTLFAARSSFIQELGLHRPITGDFFLPRLLESEVPALQTSPSCGGVLLVELGLSH